MLCLCTFCTYAWLTDKVARYLKIENEMQLQGNMHILYYNFLVVSNNDCCFKYSGNMIIFPKFISRFSE